MIYYRFSYIFIPIIFYGLFIFLNEIFKFPLHFFYTTHTDFYETIFAGSVNLFCALILYFLLSNVPDNGRRKMSLAGSILTIFYLSVYVSMLLTNYIPPIIIKIIFLTIIIIFSKYNMSLLVFVTVVILFTIKMLMVGGRAELIIFLMFYFRNFLTTSSFIKLVLLATSTVLFLMIGLQALESKNYVFLNLANTLYSQIIPIWLNSILMLRHEFSLGMHIAEVLPTARPILEAFNIISQRGPIDVIAYKYLPTDIYSIGVRLGSNSTFTITNYWSLVIIPAITLILVTMKKLKGVSQLVNTYLLIYSPFIIRRNIYSYLYDLLLLVAVSIVLSFCKNLIQGQRQR